MEYKGYNQYDRIIEMESPRKLKELNEHVITKEEMELDKLKKSIGRNSLCPCGSGKKYKNCCLNKQKKERRI